MAAQPNVEFWFDPICPFTWITSRWLDEVAETRGFPVVWNPFSLEILNVGLDEGDDAEAHAQGHRLGRVVEAARTTQGQEHLAALYTELGERIHPGERRDFDAIIAESLVATGLPTDLAAAADDSAYDAGLRESTERALAKTGRDVGIPIISVDGRAFFGPVVTPRPQGQAALELWDAYRSIITFDGFFELKRQITGDIVF